MRIICLESEIILGRTIFDGLARRKITMEKTRKKLRILLICLVLAAVVIGIFYYYYNVKDVNHTSEGALVVRNAVRVMPWL